VTGLKAKSTVRWRLLERGTAGRPENRFGEAEGYFLDLCQTNPTPEKEK